MCAATRERVVGHAQHHRTHASRRASAPSAGSSPPAPRPTKTRPCAAHRAGLHRRAPDEPHHHRRHDQRLAHLDQGPEAEEPLQARLGIDALELGRHVLRVQLRSPPWPRTPRGTPAARLPARAPQAAPSSTAASSNAPGGAGPASAGRPLLQPREALRGGGGSQTTLPASPRWRTAGGCVESALAARLAQALRRGLFRLLAHRATSPSRNSAPSIERKPASSRSQRSPPPATASAPRRGCAAESPVPGGSPGARRATPSPTGSPRPSPPRQWAPPPRAPWPWPPRPAPPHASPPPRWARTRPAAPPKPRTAPRGRSA